MKDEIIEELEAKLKKSLEAFKKDLSRLRTGIASVSLLDDIRINYYNQPTPINQVASLSVPDNRTILIQPWDTSIIGEIEKAIQKSDLGVNPVSDGKIIRIILPRLTEERRRELVKQGGKMLENARVAMRNIRREINEKLKKMEKEKLISKDDFFKKQENVQKVTDKYIEMAEMVYSEKEKEILEI
jgi:ribosome recycling factor